LPNCLGTIDRLRLHAGVSWPRCSAGLSAWLTDGSRWRFSFHV
jgi:hypothetical protein